MPRSVEVLSHWHHSVENLSTSSLDFYSSLEQALNAKQIPGLSLLRVDWNEGGVLSAKRTYLRIGHGRLVFDVSAFPFGKAFMFSWWLGKLVPSYVAMAGCLSLVLTPLFLLIFIAVFGLVKGVIFFLVACGIVVFMARQMSDGGESGIEDVLIAIPVIGVLYKRMFKPVTYFSEDSRIIFEETIHRVVLDVISGILTVNRMSPLTESQRQVRAKP